MQSPDYSRGALYIFEVGIVFISALLLGLLFASVWAYVFFRDLLAISFQNELPNILIFSSVATALVVVWRSRISGRARVLLALGLALIALDVFLEIPLKKYAALVPSTSIRDWFFLFGMTEFFGMMLALIGVTTVLKKLKGKS